MKNFKDYLNIIQESDVDSSDGKGRLSDYNSLIANDNIVINLDKKLNQEFTDKMFLFQGPKDAENDRLIFRIKKILETSTIDDLYLNHKDNMDKKTASLLVRALNKKGIEGFIKNKSYNLVNGDEIKYWVMHITDVYYVS